MNCLKHLKKCKAECCETYTFNIEGEKPLIKKGNTYTFKIQDMNNDIKRYYELHENTFVKDDKVIIRIEQWEWHKKQLIIHNKCKWKTLFNKCKHYNLRPNICKELNETNHQEEKFWITPNCTLKKRGK